MCDKQAASNALAAQPSGLAAPTGLPSFLADEEGDIDAFRAYLRPLPTESLWDIRSHLDADHYPRRYEAVAREIARRNVFFVTPYTTQEAWLRGMFGWSLLLAALAAALRAIGSIPIDLQPWEKLSFFYDLAAGGPKAARMVLPLERFLAMVGEAAVLAGVVVASVRCLGRHLSREVLATGIIALVLGALFLCLAYR